MKLNRLFLSALFAVMLFSATGQTLVPLWETEKILQVPESVLYDRVTQNIYVSCINGNPSAKDGNGYIARLDKNGKILKLKWITGEKKALVEAGGMIDGLIPVGNLRFIISDWKGKVQLTGINIPPVVLRNTTNEKINAADLGYISKERTLLIPTFFDNRVAAFKLTE